MYSTVMHITESIVSSGSISVRVEKKKILLRTEAFKITLYLLLCTIINLLKYKGKVFAKIILRVKYLKFYLRGLLNLGIRPLYFKYKVLNYVLIA